MTSNAGSKISRMERWNKLRQALPLILMICAGLFFVGALLPTLLGQGSVGIVYALMGAVVALLTKKIADRHRAQRDLMNLNVELEQRVKERTAQLHGANTELEAFSYTVAHDLRGPLQQVSGFTELLQLHATKPFDAEVVLYLDFIKKSVWRMSSLIDALLNFSRAERVDLLKSTVSVEQLVKEVRQELLNHTEGTDIEWKLGALPEVYADQSMLRLAIVNLLSNAIKFSRGRAGAEIEIGSTIQENEVVVFVRDNGVGFDMMQADKLFGVFQRLHTNQEFEGTGIGLASVQRIIHRHRGRIWAEGSVGGGATFWFSLPRATKPESQEQSKP
jgi:light-regulated signal transduction histidine kinase (bacteriophytochrome)